MTSISRGVVAQVLSAGMWISDLAGHPAVGTVLHDPRTINAVTVFLASAFTMYGIFEHLRVAYEGIAAKEALHNFATNVSGSKQSRSTLTDEKRDVEL